jgi:hypothetical protein
MAKETYSYGKRDLLIAADLRSADASLSSSTRSTLGIACVWCVYVPNMS